MTTGSSGLLGRPQTISRHISGPFELTRADIENVFYLLEQRISSQNEGTLIQFTVRVIYDDGSSVLLNSLADFQAYNEVRPLISNGTTLSWTFLIQFRNKSYPEKQQIDVTFATSGGYVFDETTFAPIFVRRMVPNAPVIRTQISHTDRSWGTDIDTLLKGHLEMLLKPEKGIRVVANKYSGTLGFLSGIAVLISALAVTSRVTDSLIDRYMAEARSAAALGENTFEAIAKKIDFLINVVASGLWTRYAFYVTGFVLLSLIASIACGGFVSAYAETKRPSFVLLTKKSEEQRDAQLKAFENNWFIFFASLVGTLAIAVLGNYIFYKLMQYVSL
jgi:hypothetical protein